MVPCHAKSFADYTRADQDALSWCSLRFKLNPFKEVALHEAMRWKSSLVIVTVSTY